MKQVYSMSHSLDTLFMDNNSPMQWGQWSIKMKFTRLGSSLHANLHKCISKTASLGVGTCKEVMWLF